LDDWGLVKHTAEHRRDLLEILVARHGRGSSLPTRQLPVQQTIADSALRGVISFTGLVIGIPRNG
jgi:hypothetical protein